MSQTTFSLLAAQASYATFSGTTREIVVAALSGQQTRAGFSASQANQFADHYQLVAHAPNDGTGFSATVISENTPGGPPRYTIAETIVKLAQGGFNLGVITPG